MRISIVTISLNQARFLEEALLSVLNQHYDDLEFIVVDAVSTDGSMDIINRYKGRITTIIHEPDSGPADGLNKGFRSATGEIFGYLNADDVYLPDTFKKVSKIFSDFQSVDVVCGGGFIIDEKGKILRKVYSDHFNRNRYLYGAVTIMQQSTFFRKKAFRATGGFNIRNRTCWDGELMLTFSRQNKKIKTFNELWSSFRIYRNSISGSGQSFNQYRGDIERFFSEEYGRHMNRGDRVLASLMRIEKWFIHPTALFNRVVDFQHFARRRSIQ